MLILYRLDGIMNQHEELLVIDYHNAKIMLTTGKPFAFICIIFHFSPNEPGIPNSEFRIWNSEFPISDL